MRGVRQPLGDGGDRQETVQGIGEGSGGTTVKKLEWLITQLNAALLVLAIVILWILVMGGNAWKVIAAYWAVTVAKNYCVMFTCDQDESDRRKGKGR